METITVATTRKDQVLDITDTIESFLQREEQENGICVAFAAHTTCALTTADLDPGTDLDLLAALRHLLPHVSYRHPHDPTHTPDHILSTLIGPSVAIPFARHQLLLGTWQRVILVELDGPRQRTIHLACM
ncbi:MAG: hypothetical protein OJF49_004024 [Ktedonobacterales bacterium]|jgi:secondary thiamine-phosphate synthase enzyme|nr:MAG: hypothetical protein OJF49_004024 [Ktedonobacterales bacterium]